VDIHPEFHRFLKRHDKETLPRQRQEVAVLAKQMLRSGTSVAAHAHEASPARSDAELCS